jgi:ABC-type uncharacterized transport system substrate-binding protein
VNRRTLLSAAALMPFTGLVPARAADEEVRESRVARVVIFTLGTPANFHSRAEAFIKGMEALGYVEGRNVLYIWRSANGQPEILREHARDIVRSGADVVLAGGGPSARELLRVQVPFPVVLVTTEDPVTAGFARSLQRSGTNFTGIAVSNVGEAGRYIEYLAQAAGKVQRVGVLGNPASAMYAPFRSRLEASAAKTGPRLVILDARSRDDVERLLPGPLGGDVDSMIVMNDSLFYNERATIIEAAATARRPVIYPSRDYVEAGGLMSYGPHIEANFRRAAEYVDRVIKGAKPAEMAFEQSSRFELAINRATVKTLGLQIPTLLKRADRLIG